MSDLVRNPEDRFSRVEAHMVSEKKIFLCFSHDTPGVGPAWTPGAQLAGFIKRTTLHCYTQNMKALGLMVSKKRFSHDTPRAGPV